MNRLLCSSARGGRLVLESAPAYARVLRPRILLLSWAVMAVAAWLAIPSAFCPRQVAALAGAGLVIAGAMALNQRVELARDARMARTADRPVPSGRLRPRRAAAFGAALSLAGAALLAFLAPPAACALAAASWTLYVVVYTLLKTRSAWQTPIGALAGAAPPLLGAAVVGQPAHPAAAALFAAVFFWQLPHAMAIAWLYCEEFRAAGVRVATVVDPSGRRAGWLAVAGAIGALPSGVAVVMIVAGAAPGAAPLGRLAAGATVVLGLVYLAAAVAFLHRRDDRAARRLLRASLGYLPLLILLLILESLGG